MRGLTGYCQSLNIDHAGRKSIKFQEAEEREKAQHLAWFLLCRVRLFRDYIQNTKLILN